MEYILFSFILAGIPALYTGYCNNLWWYKIAR